MPRGRFGIDVGPLAGWMANCRVRLRSLAAFRDRELEVRRLADELDIA